jgi:hypothetical protein
MYKDTAEDGNHHSLVPKQRSTMQSKQVISLVFFTAKKQIFTKSWPNHLSIRRAGDIIPACGLE